MQITRGIVPSAQKVIIYGPEGIGKSTFAARFPDPLFIDTEGSTKQLDVARTPRPSSWSMLMEQVRYVKANPGICKTLVIDTADWAEQLCMAELCAKAQKAGIEDWGYGRGYVYLAEEFGRLLNLLSEIIEQGVHVVFTAHAKIRKFDQPDELGSYDRWEMKLQKMTAPLVKEWADMVLFANYKTYVVNVDGQGAEKGRNKAQGGARVMYTAHHTSWDAKNRHGLQPELKFDFSEIAHCFQSTAAPMQAPAPSPVPTQPASAQTTPAVASPVPLEPTSAEPTRVPEPSRGIPQALKDLLMANAVLEKEIQMAVADKGYYPEDTPIENYDPAFINGVLVAAWPQVYQMVLKIRESLPF